MKTAYFISPHLDDAFFSAGGMMLKLLNDNYSVVVVNIFSEADNGAGTLSAKAFLQQVGRANAVDLYTERKAEDKKVLKSIGVKVINLGYTEALWRKKTNPNFFEKLLSKLLPEFIHVYATYRFHIIKGIVAKNDLSLIQDIKNNLLTVMDQKADMIFCPIGIGGHVDHIIVRDACAITNDNVIYWADIPYKAYASWDKSFVSKNSLVKCVFDNLSYLNKKDAISKGYQSQYQAVLGDHNYKVMTEEFYSKKDVC